MKVTKLHLCCNHDYFTETKNCSCNKETTPHKIYYCIDETDYGRLRTSSGDIRLFKSYSGAYKAMKKLSRSLAGWLI